MVHQGHILVVDDEPIVCELLKAALSEGGFTADVCHNLTHMREAISRRTYDAVLVDLYLDNEDGLEALPFISREAPYTKVIMMSAHGTVELAVTAMEKGATSFLAKSKDPSAIVEQLRSRLISERGERAEATRGLSNFGLVGTSRTMMDVARKIEQFKDVDSTVLITGESGTGKELVARAIHDASGRKGAFAAINCGAIPANLLESELFGHKRGAFTDAKNDRVGIFEQCSGGTLLLDEIGEMPHDLQVKLLRVLQERTVTPLGSGRPIRLDTRVIAATNRILADEVKEGRFREDLYFRLAVLTIDLPPLRDRKEDIKLLTEHFLRKMNTKFNKNVRLPSKELEAKLMAHPWYGNVRELQNAIERGIVMSRDNEMHFEDMIQPARVTKKNDAVGMEFDVISTPLSEAKQKFEKEYLKQLLELTRGNISEIARISGRYRADVYRLLSKHGVEWEDFR